jgi:endonuclease/exonuclease/phosphatase family metal-dependent hydrolase
MPGTAQSTGRVRELVVMTFNVRTALGLDGWDLWWLRRRSTVGAIAGLVPDVAGLQEVRPVQMRYLARRLPGYGFVSPGRARRRWGGEQCPVLFRADRFKVAGAEARWFDADRQGRMATVARLVDLEDGCELTVVNTHFDHRSAQRRAASAAAVVGWLAEAPGPCVVMGDLNAPVGEASVVHLLEAGLADALGHLPARGPGAATAHAFTGRLDGARIDHILVSGDHEVLEGSIVHDRPRGRLPSDHWPVMARLRPAGSPRR